MEKEKYVYKHVVIVGLDGMGNFCKDTDTPFMDKIFKDGARSLYSQSLFPTISAQNWGAMLIGTDPDVHGLTNTIISRERYTNKQYPSIFTTVREAMPDAVLCSVSNWDPINYGIIEEGIGAEKQTADNGTHTTDKVVSCVKERKPTLLFIQIDDPDEAGHHYCYGTEGHLECIRNTDKLVNRIHEAYEEAGILEDTLFITITDHGGWKNGHGGNSPEERNIFFALKGKTVRENEEFFGQTKDINAIVRHAFGLPVPAFDAAGYSSQVPLGVFTDHEGEYIRIEGKRFDPESLPTPAIDSENGLFTFFPKEEVKLAMFFDNDLSDASGHAIFTEERRVKYYSNGVRGSYAELGATGIAVSGDVKFGKDSFTVAQWLKVDDAPNWECFSCSTKTMSDSGPGFTLGFTSGGTLLGIETEDSSTYHDPVHAYAREVSGGWIHSLYSFNKKTLAIDIYHNFRYKGTYQLPDIFDIPMDALPFTVGDDASHIENKRRNIIFCMDDLFIFNKAFTEEDVKKLAAYYGM